MEDFVCKSEQSASLNILPAALARRTLAILEFADLLCYVEEHYGTRVLTLAMLEFSLLLRKSAQTGGKKSVTCSAG